MAFEFVASAEYNSLSSTSATINKPTGTTDGDIMFAIIATQNGYASSIPSGWTSLGQNIAGTAIEIELFYKIASSEGANYTRSGFSSGYCRGLIVTYRGGFDTTDPIDVVSNTQYITSDSSVIAESMSVSSDKSPMIFIAHGVRTSTVTFTKPSTPTTDWLEDYDGGSVNSYGRNEVCSMTWTSNGDTGDMTSIMSVSLANKHAFAVALNPAAEGNPGAFFQMF